MAFRTLRHVLRPAIREGTRYTLLLFAGWGARGPWGGTSQISPFLVILGIKKKRVPRGATVRTSIRWVDAVGGCDEPMEVDVPPGTGTAFLPILAGIKAMNGTLSAERCVKLAPCSAPEARE